MTRLYVTTTVAFLSRLCYLYKVVMNLAGYLVAAPAMGQTGNK